MTDRSQHALVIVAMVMGILTAIVLFASWITPRPTPPVVVVTPIGPIETRTPAPSGDPPAVFTRQPLTSGTPAPCSAKGPLPDMNCTPGATDPRVTQDTIQTTICVPGYTAKVRPPVSVTEPIKRERMRAYGVADQDPRGYELDHLVPLEIGGAPQDIHNLWPEASTPTPGYHQKDQYENYLRREVCASHMSLLTAQQQIARDWYDGWVNAGKPLVGGEEEP